jgi:hypothetical protein
MSFADRRTTPSKAITELTAREKSQWMTTRSILVLRAVIVAFHLFAKPSSAPAQRVSDCESLAVFLGVAGRYALFRRDSQEFRLHALLPAPDRVEFRSVGGCGSCLDVGMAQIFT